MHLFEIGPVKLGRNNRGNVRHVFDGSQFFFFNTHGRLRTNFTCPPDAFERRVEDGRSV